MPKEAAAGDVLSHPMSRTTANTLYQGRIGHHALAWTPGATLDRQDNACRV